MAVARARVANASIRTVQDSGQRKRWRWLGHVWRMPPFALSKTAVRESDGGGQGTCGECLHSHCPRQRSEKAMAVARARVANASIRTVQDSGQGKRWRWLGHVWRMPPFALSKTAVRESDGGG